MSPRPPSLVSALVALALCLCLGSGLRSAETPFGKGLLWKVTAPNGRVSHLLGTLQSSDPRVLDLPPAVRSAFDASEHLAVELVMTPEARARLGQAKLLNDGRNLELILGPNIFRRAAIAARTYGLSPAQLKTFKPWGLFLLLGAPPSEMMRGAEGRETLDLRLQTLARQQGRPILGLESAREQIGAFDGLTEDEQIAMLDVSLQYADEIETWYEKLLLAYLERDIQLIKQMMLEPSTDQASARSKALNEGSIGRRNLSLAIRSRPLLDQGRAFIAIAAFHLPGTAGVLSLLEQQGYKVARVY